MFNFRLTLSSIMVLSALNLISACAEKPQTDKTDETAQPAIELAPVINATDSLQAAAQQAQTQDNKRSYLTENPGSGFLTPEIINRSPALSGKTLSSVKIAPNGEFITVLQGREDDAQQQDLWAYDLTSGEGRLLVSSTDILGEPEVLSEEEKNRRERAREYGKGIVSYSWVGDSLLLFPLGGDIYLYDLETKESQQVTATKGYETDPKVSRDGTKVSYVRENELYIKNLKTGLERQLSDGATDTIRNATASFVVQEELNRRTGYWVSPKADRIAYTQIDESGIAIENRLDFGADGVVNIAQRYPFAGTTNATVKLGIVSAKGGRTRWLDLGEDKDIYLTRVVWSADGGSVIAGILSRDQKTHIFKRFNAATGQGEVIYTETSPTWLNIGSTLRALKEGGLLWKAQRNDKAQIFKIDNTGEVVALTPDNLNVHSLLCRNSETGDMFVSGWQETPLETHIFKVSPPQNDKPKSAESSDKAGDESAIDVITEATSTSGETTVEAETETTEAAPIVTQITTRAGQHSARFNKDCSRFIGSFSGLNTPKQTQAFEADGTPLAWLNKNSLDETHPYAPYMDNHITPEFGQISAEDGTLLDYMLFKPVDLRPGEKRASITIVYGGPNVQRVKRDWRNQFAQMLAHHGFVVFQLDNRGATNRGKAFEDSLYRSMGTTEVVDQVTGAEFLRSKSYIDPDRMGVYGWSYGGYMTLHMLGQTELYKSGVSGAPVTDWSLYDTAYTERFLGSPVKDSANYTEGAYENGNVLAHLEGITEPVLLIHGMADDNVVFRNSIILMDAMQKSGKQNLRVMTYPGEKHGFRNPANKTHRDRQILEFFLETLDIEK
ncbi:dipeptidyl-peptidase IV [Litorimonas taeanensis]|uniref:Dipeptidyl-peptidase IV n=1 Tax=Litorimonas taeanensis TaxID=568099 RepID=A0A420WFM3_9PROT|nr:DPP IV N-terminal domain-containing protein [Litorimonas taeanensis]RKQ69787.1 dipeptidyl-peptidase IV [Litorimonas taeanensis]